MTRISIIMLLSSLLSSCVTHHINAPAPEPVKNRTVAIENGQLGTGDRVIGTDGFATQYSDYHEWAEYIITKLENQLSHQNITSAKQLSLEIEDINCGGHFVADCQITLVLRSSDYKKLYTGERKNGYPYSAAREKAIDSVIDKISGDPELIKWLVD